MKEFSRGTSEKEGTVIPEAGEIFSWGCTENPPRATTAVTGGVIKNAFDRILLTEGRSRGNGKKIKEAHTNA